MQNVNALNKVYISGRGIVSAAGDTLPGHWKALEEGSSFFSTYDTCGKRFPVAIFQEPVELQLLSLRKEKRDYFKADRAVLAGVLAARAAHNDAGLPDTDGSAVVFASSRGTTQTLERELQNFYVKHAIDPHTSPHTSSGIFASLVARDRLCTGLSLCVSAACTSGLHAIGIASLLVKSGQVPSAFAGAAEAPIGNFTITLLNNLGVLTSYGRSEGNLQSERYPCKPGHSDRSGMVLAEGAASLFLDSFYNRGSKPQAEICGYGCATEVSTLTGLSAEGCALATAISQALSQAQMFPQEVDLIVGHGSGTKKGDAAEMKAYHQVFGDVLPELTFLKWMTGHMLGASAAVSVVLSVEFLQRNLVPALPYVDGSVVPHLRAPHRRKILQTVLVTALGFGGNAAAMIVTRVS